VGATGSKPLEAPHVGRGLAAGDLDNDGRIDVLAVSQNEPLVVLMNRTPRAGHWITLRLEGTRSNRDAVGAVVTIRAGGRSQTLQRFAGGSFESAGDPRIHAGLGPAERADEVVIRWPTGRMDTWKALEADGGYLIREGEAPRPLPGFGRPGS
jgi:hypothetical protein